MGLHAKGKGEMGNERAGVGMHPLDRAADHAESTVGLEADSRTRTAMEAPAVRGVQLEDIGVDRGTTMSKNRIPCRIPNVRLTISGW